MFPDNDAASSTGVIKLTSSDLLRYDKLRRGRGLTWRDVLDGEEMEPEGESPFGEMDNDTHIRISNCRPVWQELFHVQRKSNLAFCDVHLITDEGYIPVHSAFLRGLSPFLDSLLPKVNRVSCKYDVLSISLPDLKMSHLKAFLGLIYTGSVVTGPDANAEDIRSVMKLLQIGEMSLDSVHRRGSSGRKMKSKLVRSYRTDSDEAIKDKDRSYGMTRSAEPQTQTGLSVSATSTAEAEAPPKVTPAAPPTIPSLLLVQPRPGPSSSSRSVVIQAARKRGRGRPRKSSEKLSPKVPKTVQKLVARDEDKDEPTPSIVNQDQEVEGQAGGELTLERPIRTLRQAMTSYVKLERMTDETIQKLVRPSPRQNQLVGEAPSSAEVITEDMTMTYSPESKPTTPENNSSNKRMTNTDCAEDSDDRLLKALPSHQSKVPDEEMTRSPNPEPEANPPNNSSKFCMKNSSIAKKRKVNNSENEEEDENVDAFVKRLRTQTLLTTPTIVNAEDNPSPQQNPAMQSQSQFAPPIPASPSPIPQTMIIHVKEEKKRVVNAGLQLMLQNLTKSLEKVTSVPSPTATLIPFHDNSIINNQITDESNPLVPAVEQAASLKLKPILETPPPSSSSSTSRQSEDTDNEENVTPEEQVIHIPSHDEQDENSGHKIKLEDQDRANNENIRLLTSSPVADNIVQGYGKLNEFDPQTRHPQQRAPLLPTPIMTQAYEEGLLGRLHEAFPSEYNPFIAAPPPILNGGNHHGQNQEIWTIPPTTSTSHPQPPSLSRHRNRKQQRNLTRPPPTPILPLMHPSLIVPLPGQAPHPTQQLNPFIFGQASPFQHGHHRHPFLPFRSRGHHNNSWEGEEVKYEDQDKIGNKMFPIYR